MKPWITWLVPDATVFHALTLAASLLPPSSSLDEIFAKAEEILERLYGATLKKKYEEMNP